MQVLRRERRGKKISLLLEKNVPDRSRKEERSNCDGNKHRTAQGKVFTRDVNNNRSLCIVEKINFNPSHEDFRRYRGEFQRRIGDNVSSLSDDKNAGLTTEIGELLDYL